MRIIVTGAEGQVGGEFAAQALSSGHFVLNLPHSTLDICNADAVRAIVADFKPTHIVNAAAYNAVDKAEDDEVGAFSVNALGPKNLADAAAECNAVVVHYSTDYVFDGTKKDPYREDDAPSPISVYGRSKLEGEVCVARSCEKHYIIRTAWVFAPGGNNFISRFLAKVGSIDSFNFINDNWGTPTYAMDVARVTLELLERNAPFGIYHAAGRKECTPYEWALKVRELASLKVSINGISASDYSTRARRPVRSVMANTKLDSLGISMPDGLERMGAYFEGRGGGSDAKR